MARRISPITAPLKKGAMIKFSFAHLVEFTAPPIPVLPHRDAVKDES